MQNKCVLVHAGARDQYEVALALQNRNFLEKLVTDLYCSDFLTDLSPVLKEKYYKNGISSKQVVLSKEALWAKGVMSVRKDFSLNQKKDHALSKKAYKLANRTFSHLFCYSYYAAYAFSQPKAFEEQKKLLFQLHPHPFSVKKILEEELINVPDARASILYENEFQYSESYLNQLAAEASAADAIVVASNYTRNTLIQQGIDKDKIEVVPYGIASDSFVCRTEIPRNKKLRIIFVGSMVQRKGLSYLLEAIRVLGNSNVEIILCGRGFIDETLLKGYTDISISIKRNLSQRELISELHRSDVFVLPTLSEGFAQVILEAMACGIPVISTPNSCAPDVLTEGKEGFIVPVKDAEALVERLEYCLLNKNELFEMGKQASLTAQSFTWQKFRTGIIDFYEAALKTN